MNLLQSNNTSSLFGQASGGSGLFGGGGGNKLGGSNTPIFGSKTGGSGLLGSSNSLFQSPSTNTGGGGGMLGGGGGLGGGLLSGLGGGGGSKGTINVKYQPTKNKDGIQIQSITGQRECQNKTLDELRAEDYSLLKGGQVPDNVKQQIMHNIQGGQRQGGTTGGLGGGLFGGNTGGSSLFGGGSTGGNTGSGGLFSQNQQAGGGGGLPSLSLTRGNVIPGPTTSGGIGGLGGGGGGLFGNKQGGTSGGGLFGQAGGTQGGGLFNQGGGNQGGGAGGLFGNKQAGTSGGGLFNQGGGTQGGGNQGGGLFNQAGNQGGGLFSQGGNQQGAGGGLFGNKQGGGGLFSQGGSQGGGLFSQQQGGGGGGGGLFSQGGNQQGAGGGLFGNKQGGGGLFSQGGSQGGGLFSQQQGGGGGGGGLFSQGGGGGGLLNQGGGGSLLTQGGSQGGGIFGQQKPGGLFNQGANPHLFNYESPAENPVLMYADPSWLPKLQESMVGATTPQTKETPIEKKDETTYTPNNTLEKKDQGYRGKKTLNELAMTYGSRSSLDAKTSLIDYSGTGSTYSSFDKLGTSKLQDSEKKMAHTESFKWRLGPHSIVRRMHDDHLYDRNNLSIDSKIEIMLRPKPIHIDTLDRSSSRSVLSGLNDSRLSIGSKNKKNIYDNTIPVELGVRIGAKEDEIPLLIKMYKEYTIFELKKAAIEKIHKEGKLVGFIESHEDIEALARGSELIADSRILNDNLSLKDVGFSNDNNRAIFFIDTGYYAPKLTKEGYETNPPIEELAEMTKEQLRAVEGFAIWNKWGKVEFLGETDVIGLDLDELVDIRHTEAEVYPEAKFPTESSKPRRGEKLNKPAIITLYKCNIKRQDKSSKTKSKEGSSKETPFEVLGYDKVTGEYRIKVEHFTKYGFDVDDDEEIEEEGKGNLPPSQQKPGLHEQDIMRNEIRTPGVDFLPENQDFLRKAGQRRGFEPQNEDVYAESQGSESDRLRKMIKDKPMQEGNEDEIFNSSDEDAAETYSQQFRKRHAGTGLKILKGNQERIFMPQEPQPQPHEDEMNEIEPEAGREDIRDQEERPEEQLEEEPSQTRFTELLSLADSFTAHSRDRLDATTLVKRMNQNLKKECDRAINSLNLFNGRVIETSSRQVNPQEKQFYLNRSFRVGWSRNGLAFIGNKRTISAYKITLHKELGYEEENGPFEYERYKRNLAFVSKALYEPFLRALVDNSICMEDMENLSLGDDSQGNANRSFLKFPSAQSLSFALIQYVENIGRKQVLKEEVDEEHKMIFGEFMYRDVEILSLFNTLFGKCALDLWEFTFEKQDITESEREELFNKIKQSNEEERYSSFMRKHGLSKWLKRKCDQFVKRDIKENKQGNKAHSKSERILLYLTGGQIKTATDLCNGFEDDNPIEHETEWNRLAILLSNFSGNQKVKKTIQDQVNDWERNKQIDHISVTEIVKKIYKFLSGDLSVVDVYDWTRLFGIHLWYLCKPHINIPEVLNNFCDSLEKEPRYENTVTIFNAPKENKNKYYELGYLLIGLFSQNKNFEMRKVLNPYTYTEDCLDVKFVWLVTEFIAQNKKYAGTRDNGMVVENSTKETEFRYRVLRNFCFQLELLGLWDYAIYAILLASTDVIQENQKWRYVKEIIQRNYKENEILSSDSKSRGIKKKGKKKELLVEILGLKQKLLHESKAYKYLHTFGYTKAVKNLTKCGLWQEAHEVLSRELAPITLCNVLAHGSDAEEAKKLLLSLQKHLKNLSTKSGEIDFWQKEGVVLEMYLAEVLNQDPLKEDDIDIDHMLYKVLQYEQSQHNLSGKVYIDKIKRDFVSSRMKRLSSSGFLDKKDQILDFIEKLDTQNKEDKTEIALQFLEKDASY